MEEIKKYTKQEIIERYFSKFDKFNKYELWEERKWFVSHWDINAPNFAEMLEHALWAAKFIENQWWQPICGVVGIAKYIDREEQVRRLFKDLFTYGGNGLDSLQCRVENFITEETN